MERPQEVVGFLEVLSESVNFVDQVFNALDSEFSQAFFDNLVRAKGNSLSVKFSVSSFVDHVFDGFSGGESVGDPGFDHSQHVHGGLVILDENSGSDLGESEKLEDFLGFGGNLVDTLDSDDQEEFGLRRNVELGVGQSFSVGFDFSLLGV